MTKFADGCFTFYRVGKSFKPLLPSQVESVAMQHGMPAVLIPRYAGDRAAVSRAITQTAPKAAKQGCLLRKIVAEKTRVVYGIVAESTDKEQETVDLNYEDNLEWSVVWDNGSRVHGGHAMAFEVDDAYQDLRGKIVGADWTDVLTLYFTEQCHATPMREDGRLFWIPPTRMGLLETLKAFLSDIGITLVLLEIEPENKTVIVEAATENLEEQLQALQDEVEAFDGKQRMGTYKDRLTQYQALRRKAILYRDVLGVGIKDAEDVLTALEDKVVDLMVLKTEKAKKESQVAVVIGNEEVAF